jgi:hypothetical protein
MGPRRTAAGVLATLAITTIVVAPATPSQAAPSLERASTASAVHEGPPRPRYVRMIRCTKTEVDVAAETVRCRRTTTSTVLAVKNGSSWQLESATGVFVDVPYVWSAKRRALVLSPSLAWEEHVDRQYAYPPASWFPRRIPERPLPPRPSPVDGQGSPGSYAFTDTDGLDPLTAYRFDRCTEIRWTADLTRAAAYGIDPDTVLAVATSAFADVSAVTGYAFRYVGRSDGLLDGAQAQNPPRGARDWTHRADIGLTIGSFDDDAGYQFDGLEGGILGYDDFTSLAEPIGRYRPITWGYIAIDGQDLGPDGSNPAWDESVAPEARLTAILRHEIGHMMGLDHVSDSTQLMQAQVGDLFDYANGDRRGMWELASPPCFPDKVAHQVR